MDLPLYFLQRGKQIMDFGIIFLCLLFGAIVGYEFGKSITARKLNEALGKLCEDMQKSAEEKEQKRKEVVKEFADLMNSICDRKEKEATDDQWEKK